MTYTKNLFLIIVIFMTSIITIVFASEVDDMIARAERGDPIAQYSLGERYSAGEGVLQNYVLAHMWYNLAGANGVETASGLRDKLAEKMTAPQIAEAQLKASNWFNSRMTQQIEPTPNSTNSEVINSEDIEPQISKMEIAVEEKKPVLEEKVVTNDVISSKGKTTFVDCEECPQMVEVPAGSYSRGNKYGDQTQRPKQTISIPNSFAVGIFEVTISEWEACVVDGGCNGYRPYENIDIADMSEMPVTNVSWQDTKNYLNWISQKTEKTYRLPSEAEWEYVAKGGTTSRFSWGDSLSEGANTLSSGDDVGGRVPKKGNGAMGFGIFLGPMLPMIVLKGLTSMNYKEAGITPVGSFVSNPWGLYDVHGNVWEWVEDCYNKNYFGAPRNGSARTEKCSTSYARVVRGGTTMNNLNLELSEPGERKSENNGKKLFNLGFRVVRDN